MIETAPEMSTTALAPWFGSNRDNAEAVGVELGPLAWVGVPFTGGGCELRHIKTRAGVANDLHRHMVNLGRVINTAELKRTLAEKLAGTLFHPDELADAQRRCLQREAAPGGEWFGLSEDASPTNQPDVAWAYDYFICCWMGRSAMAGTAKEFDGKLSTRWTSSGGDSAVRFRSATDSLEGWHQALLPWSFSCIDAFKFIPRVNDAPTHGIYCDAPWPNKGDDYKHAFDVTMQRRLAEEMGRFKQTRVVIRYEDHPLIRELYPEGRWTWARRKSRNQGNNQVAEVLILNGPSRA